MNYVLKIAATSVARGDLESVYRVVHKKRAIDVKGVNFGAK